MHTSRTFLRTTDNRTPGITAGINQVHYNNNLEAEYAEYAESNHSFSFFITSTTIAFFLCMGFLLFGLFCFCVAHKIRYHALPFLPSSSLLSAIAMGWVLQLIISRFFLHIFAYSSSEFVPSNLRIMVSGVRWLGIYPFL